MRLYVGHGRSVDIPYGYYERRRLAEEMREVASTHDRWGHRKSDHYHDKVERDQAREVLKYLKGP